MITQSSKSRKRIKMKLIWTVIKTSFQTRRSSQSNYLLPNNRLVLSFLKFNKLTIKNIYKGKKEIKKFIRKMNRTKRFNRRLKIKK
jgi:hypothetical protein